MTLNDRDFNSITKEESLLWDAVKEQEKVIINGEPNLLLKKTLYRQYPKAVRHFLSLFPNNFIDAVDLINESEIFKKKLQDFNNLLENQITERHILNFINDEKAHFIIGATLKINYRFGNHSLFIFPEFKLPPN